MTVTHDDQPQGAAGTETPASPPDSPTIDDPDQTSFLGAAPASPASDTGYRVLARQYRPQTFAEVVGQEALVRTLTNAFATGRVAHAFILTGIRGTGKTTTARIIAKCLNCIGPDGTGSPTIDPCGQCEHCRSIAEDRHLDVIEMDAASRTGVDDIREILDGVRYKPVSARNKVYIIDEVHMLSRNAFNALLKTLEEPPSNVTFIFATTEIRKVPVTVLSRCQRFDLRRIPDELLIAHLGKVAATEGATVPDDALRLLARAGDGSARDAMSLLDQAIAHGDGKTSEAEVRAMLGLADAGLVYDLFEGLMRGDIATALATLRNMYDAGADPLIALQDLLELTHWLTRMKVSDAAVADATLSQLERDRGHALAQQLSIPSLSRAWQVLLKGVGEVQTAPAALPAAEMVLIRLAYMADLPSPADLVKQLEGASEAQAPPPPAATAPADPGPSGGRAAATAIGAAAPAPAELQPQPQETQPARAADPASFRDLVALFGERREAQLSNHLYHQVNLVSYEPGRLEISIGTGAPKDLPGQLLRCLREWCGSHWQVSVADRPDAEPTLDAQDKAAQAAMNQRAEQHPLVRAVMETFPGARIARVTPHAGVADDAPDLSYDDTALDADFSNGDDDA